MSESQGSVLADVGHFGPELLTITDRRDDLVTGVADNDADLRDARSDHLLDAVEENRLVGHEHELLGAGVSDRPQPRSRPAREDQTLHRG